MLVGHHYFESIKKSFLLGVSLVVSVGVWEGRMIRRFCRLFLCLRRRAQHTELVVSSRMNQLSNMPRGDMYIAIVLFLHPHPQDKANIEKVIVTNWRYTSTALIVDDVYWTDSNYCESALSRWARSSD
jgi:hypothetical protein